MALPVLVLVGAALALRLWVLRAIPLIDTDGVIYVTLARQVRAAGSPFDSLFHPLYPLCIALLQPFVGDWELAGRLVSAISGSLLVLPAYALTRALFGADIAMLSAVLIVVHPGLVLASTSVMSEGVYTFVLVTGVWAGWRALTSGPRVLLPAAGLLFGLAYLARPEGAVYVVGLVVCGALAVASGARLRDLAGWLSAAVGAFVVVAGPYLLYLRGVHGSWMLSGKIGHNLALEQGLAGPPGAMAWRVLENAFLFEKYGLPDVLPGVLAFLVLPGVVARARRREWPGSEGLLLAASLPPFVSLAFHIESRIFVPILPFLLPFAAQGAVWVAGAVFGERRTRSWAFALVLVVALGLLPYALRPVLRPDPGAALSRQVARWVEESQPPDTVLLDRKPFVAFYSGRTFAPLGRVGPDELVAAARRAHARLVVLDSRSLPYDRPRLVPLVWSAPPPGLEVLRDFDAAPADRIRVLLVRDGG